MAAVVVIGKGPP